MAVTPIIKSGFTVHFTVILKLDKVYSWSVEQVQGVV